MIEGTYLKMKYTIWLTMIGFWVGLTLCIVEVLDHRISLNVFEFIQIDAITAVTMMTLAGMGLCIDFLRSLGLAAHRGPEILKSEDNNWMMDVRG